MSLKKKISFKKTSLFFWLIIIAGIGTFSYRSLYNPSTPSKKSKENKKIAIEQYADKAENVGETKKPKKSKENKKIAIEQYADKAENAGETKKPKKHKVIKKRRIAPKQYIENAVQTHIDTFSDIEKKIKLGLIHKIFFDSYAPPLVNSLNRNAPLLDPESYSAMHVFAGTQANKKHSLCYNFASNMGMIAFFDYYLNLLNFATVNGDKKMILHRRALIKTLQENPKINNRIRDIYKEANSLVLSWIDILIEDKDMKKILGRTEKEAIEATISLPVIFLDKINIYLGRDSFIENMIDTNLGTYTGKILLLFLPALTLLASTDESINRLKRSYNSLVNRNKQDFDTKKYGIGQVIDMNTQELHRRISSLTTRIRAIFTLDLGRFFWGDNYGEVVEPTDIEKYIYKILGVLGTHWYLFHPFQTTHFLFTFFSAQRTQWENRVTIAYNRLQHFYKINRLMAELNELITNSKNIKLREIKIYGGHLKRIQKFLQDEKFREIMKKINEIEKTPTTISLFRTTLNPFSTKDTNIITAYNKLSSVIEKRRGLFVNAIASFHYLSPYASIAHTTYLSSKGLAKNKCALAEILPDIKKDGTPQKPVLILDNAYTPMLKASNLTLNSIAMGAVSSNVNRDSLVITGMNGTGKTGYLLTIGGNLYISHAYGGLVLATSGKHTITDKMIFCANVTDDVSKEQSLLMAEADVLNRMVTNTTGEEKVVILIDELLKGTPQQEGHALLMASLMHLGETPNTMICTSTHLTGIPRLAKKMKYNGFTYYTTEYTKDKGLTFNIIPGQIDGPAHIHILEKMNFNREVLNESIGILKKDPNYQFKDYLPEYQEKETLKEAS